MQNEDASKAEVLGESRENHRTSVADESQRRRRGWNRQVFMVDNKLLVLLPCRDKVVRDGVEDLAEDLSLCHGRRQ